MKVDSYTESPDGHLLMANGLENPQRWDGLAASTVDVGLAAPTAAPTFTSSGAGNIIGTYEAYVRFLDGSGNPSNLSPVSAPVTILGGTTGTIAAVSNDNPILVTTSGAHGLSTGAQVLITGVLGNTAAIGSWTITVIDTTNFTLQGSNGIGAGTYTSGGTWTAGAGTVSYASVQVPAEAKVVRRQILRNTQGQAQTFFVDVDTTDVVSTTFSSTKSDVVLGAQIAVPLFDPDTGAVLANANGKPPNWKSVIATHQGYTFLAGEVAVSDGALIVTNGSTIVQGIGTSWTTALVGRWLWITGGAYAYQVNAVDVAKQQLTLTGNYLDTSDSFALYAIRPPPAERRLVYWSLGNFPESWFPGNALSLAEDSDEITGLVSFGSFLYVLEYRHIYRFTFQSNPGTDGAVFLAANRGCINHRCWLTVEGTLYMLDYSGIYGFAGNEAVEPISEAIAPLFHTQPQAKGVPRINWNAAATFHAAYYPAEQTLRWFVALDGSAYPKHALVYYLRTKAWWIEEVARPLASSCTGPYQGAQRIYCGSHGRTVLLLGENFLDGPSPLAGTVRGLATAAAVLSLSDSAAAWPTAGVVGNPVVLAGGTGAGQVRTVTAVSGTTLYVDRPWSILPDTTTVYQLGGVPWNFRSHWMRLLDSDWSIPTRLEVTWQPVLQPATATARLYLNYSFVPLTWNQSRPGATAEGMGSLAGSPDLTIDLTFPYGQAQQRLVRHSTVNLPTASRHLMVELAGVGNSENVVLYAVTVDGAS